MEAFSTIIPMDVWSIALSYLPKYSSVYLKDIEDKEIDSTFDPSHLEAMDMFLDIHVAQMVYQYQGIDPLGPIELGKKLARCGNRKWMELYKESGRSPTFLMHSLAFGGLGGDIWMIRNMFIILVGEDPSDFNPIDGVIPEGEELEDDTDDLDCDLVIGISLIARGAMGIISSVDEDDEGGSFPPNLEAVRAILQLRMDRDLQRIGFPVTRLRREVADAFLLSDQGKDTVAIAELLEIEKMNIFDGNIEDIVQSENGALLGYLLDHDVETEEILQSLADDLLQWGPRSWMSCLLENMKIERLHALANCLSEAGLNHRKDLRECLDNMEMCVGIYRILGDITRGKIDLSDDADVNADVHEEDNEEDNDEDNDDGSDDGSEGDA